VDSRYRQTLLTVYTLRDKDHAQPTETKILAISFDTDEGLQYRPLGPAPRHSQIKPTIPWIIVPGSVTSQSLFRSANE
jgi:hypothetical protein